MIVRSLDVSPNTRSDVSSSVLSSIKSFPRSFESSSFAVRPDIVLGKVPFQSLLERYVTVSGINELISIE